MTTLWDFILEIVAVFVGVLGAFELDNYRDRKAEDKERLRVLGLLRREVDANRQMLDSMTRYGPDDPIGVPSVLSMRNIWEGIVGKLGMLKDDELLEQLNELYFRLNNLDKMLDLYRQLASQCLLAPTQEKERLEPRVKSLRRHCLGFIDTLRPRIVRVLGLIDVQLAQNRSNNVTKSNTKTEEKGVP